MCVTPQTGGRTIEFQLAIVCLDSNPLNASVELPAMLSTNSDLLPANQKPSRTCCGPIRSRAGPAAGQSEAEQGQLAGADAGQILPVGSKFG
jgi:hypothetical protein